MSDNKPSKPSTDATDTSPAEASTSPVKVTTYNGWSTGDKAKRKGQLCTITKIHFETDPPSVTVKMDDNGNEVGTEFEYLEKFQVWCILFYF